MVSETPYDQFDLGNSLLAQISVRQPTCSFWEKCFFKSVQKPSACCTVQILMPLKIGSMTLKRILQRELGRVNNFCTTPSCAETCFVLTRFYVREHLLNNCATSILTTLPARYSVLHLRCSTASHLMFCSN